jgi:hypothetical protein
MHLQSAKTTTSRSLPSFFWRNGLFGGKCPFSSLHQMWLETAANGETPSPGCGKTQTMLAQQHVIKLVLLLCTTLQ